MGQCCEIIWRNGYGRRQCTRDGKFEHEGKMYCATHHPLKKIEREEEKFKVRCAKWDRQQEERTKEIAALRLRRIYGDDLVAKLADPLISTFVIEMLEHEESQNTD